jgi:hypothetical protein
MIVNSFGWHLSQTVHDHETSAVSWSTTLEFAASETFTNYD